MKTSIEYWQPDPEELAAERDARHARREQVLAPLRARVKLLRNLAEFQRTKLDRLIAEVAACPREGEPLQHALTRVTSYVEARERDPRNAAAHIDEQERKQIVAALECAGVEPSDTAILEAFAEAHGNA